MGLGSLLKGSIITTMSTSLRLLKQIKYRHVDDNVDSLHQGVNFASSLRQHGFFLKVHSELK